MVKTDSIISCFNTGQERDVQSAGGNTELPQHMQCYTNKNKLVYVVTVFHSSVTLTLNVLCKLHGII